MSITYTGVNGGSYLNTTTGPSPGDLVTAASVGLVAQSAANLSKYLYDTKVDRAGDTMTGTLTVTGDVGTNNSGIRATGDGTGAGIAAEGGASSGTGVLATGGLTNGIGLDATGRGTGTGVLASGGATGKGIICDGGGGAAAIDISTGHAIFTGTPPAANVDPGADDLLCGANIIHVRATVESNGAGGTLQGGFGIASLAGNSNGMTVTFQRAFASATEYTATVSNNSANAFFCTITERTTTSLDIRWYGVDAVIRDPTGVTLNACLMVSGRQ